MAAAVECGVIGYWSSALEGGFGASSSTCSGDLAQEQLVKCW